MKVDESHAEQLQNLLFTPLLLTDILKYGLIGLGALILMCALLAGIYLTKASCFYDERKRMVTYQKF